MLKQAASQDVATILLLSLMKQIFILPQDIFVLLREQFNILTFNTLKKKIEICMILHVKNRYITNHIILVLMHISNVHH